MLITTQREPFANVSTDTRARPEILTITVSGTPQEIRLYELFVASFTDWYKTSTIPRKL